MPTYKFRARKETPLHKVLSPDDMDRWLERRGYKMKRMLAQPHVRYFYLTFDDTLDRDTRKTIHERYGYKVSEEHGSLLRQLQFWRN